MIAELWLAACKVDLSFFLSYFILIFKSNWEYRKYLPMFDLHILRGSQVDMIILYKAEKSVE